MRNKEEKAEEITLVADIDKREYRTRNRWLKSDARCLWINWKKPYIHCKDNNAKNNNIKKGQHERI